jgi:hypothetical protein
MVIKKLNESMHEITFNFLKKAELYLSEEKALTAKIEVFQSSAFAYAIFKLQKEKNVFESIKFAECIPSEKMDYSLEINLFLVRFYNSIDRCLKQKYFLHVCPECKGMHANNSMYFDRNYLCDSCLGCSFKNGFSEDVKSSKDFIYFFESELTKLIKIGFSGNVVRRKKQIEGMQGGKINILKKINSSQKNEKYLHERFSHLKIQGEWFRPDPELLDFIKNLKSFDETIY